MKLGIEVRIDVKKIEKMRLFKGDKGTYLTMTTFIDTENTDDYGNNGFIAHKTDKNEERAPILGNSKIFWTEGEPQPHQQQAQTPAKSQPNDISFDDDVPF